MKNHYQKQSPGRTRLFYILCILLPLVVSLALLGCSSVKTHFLPNDQQLEGRSYSACCLKEKSDGLIYYLPMGKLHINAVLNTNLTTNFALMTETLSNGAMVTNFAVKVRYITNTVSVTYSPTNFQVQIFPLTLAYSNFSLTLTNSSPLSQASTNIAMSTNLAGSTNYVFTNTAAGGAQPLFTNSASSFSTSSNFTISGAISNPPSAGPQVSATIYSNTPFLYYPTNSTYSNNTEQVVTFEMPSIKTNYYYNITLGVDYVADQSNAFVLDPKMDPAHDDNFNVIVDGNGLLSTVATTNTDETGNALASLAQAAGQAFELAAGGFPSVGSISPGAGHFTAPIPGEFDPTLHTGDVVAPEIASRLPAMDERLALGINFGVQSNILRHLNDWEANGNTPESLAHLQRVLLDALNNTITTNVQLDAYNFYTAGVALRPKTAWLAASMGTNPPLRRIELLNRMLLEDAFPGQIEKTPLSSSITLPPPTPLPQYIDISFNPFDMNEMSDASNQLHSAGLNLLHITNFLSTYDQFTNVNSLVTKGSIGGIYYRQPLPYEVSVSDSASNVVSRALLFPNFSPTMHLDFKKTLFATRGTQVSMTNGFVTSYGVNKPSEIAGAAAIPGQLISSLTSGITNIVQLRLNLATGQSQISSAQLLYQSNLLQSISNQIVMQKAWQDYKAGLPAKGNPATPPSSQ